MIKPAIVAKKLSKGFGTGSLRTRAVADVSIEICSGQLTMLMGPSGSGKSTLLALLSGLLRPDAGSVEALGADLWTLTEKGLEEFRRRNFGFIFQGYNLFPALTARQQLEMVLKWRGSTPAQDVKGRAEHWLSALGLGNRGHLRPAELSGGEKQRVAIARALLEQPLVLFADEPTAALDWAHGEQVVRLLRDCAVREGSAVLLVSHDVRVADYADRVIEMSDGRIHTPDGWSGRRLQSVVA